MALGFLIGAGIGAGTYFYAKKKNASTGESALAGAATGVGSMVAFSLLSAMFWPAVILGAPVAAYYIGKRSSQKALPPAR